MSKFSYYHSFPTSQYGTGEPLVWSIKHDEMRVYLWSKKSQAFVLVHVSDSIIHTGFNAIGHHLLPHGTTECVDELTAQKIVCEYDEMDQARAAYEKRQSERVIAAAIQSEA